MQTWHFATSMRSIYLETPFFIMEQMKARSPRWSLTSGRVPPWVRRQPFAISNTLQWLHVERNPATISTIFNQAPICANPCFLFWDCP
jgi:hypothetical protein